MGIYALIRVDSCHVFPNPFFSHKALVMFIAVFVISTFSQKRNQIDEGLLYSTYHLRHC
jgi:hypothetical protein